MANENKLDPVIGRDEEIRRMLALQATANTPYTPEEVIYDYRIFSKDSSGYSRILLILIQRDTVLNFLKDFQHLQLKPEKLTLSTEGIGHKVDGIRARSKQQGVCLARANLYPLHRVEPICEVAIQISVERRVDGEGLAGLRTLGPICTVRNTEGC